jgi:hypothetical protein
MATFARAARVVIGFWCLLGLGVPGESAELEVPIVNLYRGEMNRTSFAAMTADTLRSLFGPPSVIEHPETREEGQETSLHYHALGLSFRMRPASEPARLQCWRVRLYLTQTWDGKAGRFFLPFAGRVSKQVGPDWTPQRIATEFRQWAPQSYSEAQVAALVHEPPLALAAPEAYTVLYLAFSDFHVDFLYHRTEHVLHAIQLTQDRTRPPAQR